MDTVAIKNVPRLLLYRTQVIFDRVNFLVKECGVDIIKTNKSPEILDYDLASILRIIIKSLTCSAEQALMIVRQNPQTIAWSEDDWFCLSEFYCSIGLSGKDGNDSELFSHPIDKIYARYCFYQSLGINIDANNCQLLLESESDFNNQYKVSDDDLIKYFPFTPRALAKKKRKI